MREKLLLVVGWGEESLSVPACEEGLGTWLIICNLVLQ